MSAHLRTSTAKLFFLLSSAAAFAVFMVAKA